MNGKIKRFNGNQGRIIDDNGTEYFFCSECFSTTEHPFKFCPHCGAKMNRENEAGK